VGFDAYKKAIAQADIVILATSPGFVPTISRALVKSPSLKARKYLTPSADELHE
jgi:hypothetical protein